MANWPTERREAARKRLSDPKYQAKLLRARKKARKERADGEQSIPLNHPIFEVEQTKPKPKRKYHRRRPASTDLALGMIEYGLRILRGET